MGVYYSYKCPECNFSKTFYTGGGFFSDEYYEETERLTKDFHSEILSNKYGDLIRKLLESDVDNKIHIHRTTSIFQCSKCYALMIARKKSITLFTDAYKLEVEFSQNCPDCKGEGTLKKHPDSIRCPECKKATLEIEALGSWD